MPPPAAPVARPLRGIGLALAAFALFTAMDTGIKLLGARYHVVQITFLNSLFAFAVTLLIALAQGGVRRLRSARPGLHLLRWGISFAATLCIFGAYAHLPLADVYAILFSAPLMITVLSVPILGERVGWRRATAVLVGFSGVLVMLRPGLAVVEPVALIVLAGALGHSLNMILVRLLGREDPAVLFGLVGNGLTTLATLAVLPAFWTAPTAADLAVSAAAGAIAGSGFWLLAQSFRLAPAALIAPFQYSQMPYGLLVGWLVFGTGPDGWTLAGAAIVIASGLYVLRREAGLARAAGPARP